MSERITRCPNCKELNAKIIEILNPDTHDINANAKLECESCKHTWIGKTTSPWIEEQRNKGWIR